MTEKTEGDVGGGAVGGTAKETGAGIPAAKSFSPSGAPEQVEGVDLDHPAVDSNPRARTTSEQNRIDFNDPTLSGAEAVEANMSKQG